MKEGDEDYEWIGLVVPRCCPESSSALDINTTSLAEIILLDLTSREKYGSGAGSRIRTRTKNMTVGGQYSL